MHYDEIDQYVDRFYREKEEREQELQDVLEAVPDLDLTDPEDVFYLMFLSRSEAEWNASCDEVKAANGGDYPDWWFQSIVQTGLMAIVQGTWI